jgi:hypothetical protein
MNKYLILFILFLVSIINVQAQELNIVVSVNSDRIQGTNKNVFNSMEKALYQFINGEQWSPSTTFAPNERIECNLVLTILEQTSDNTFKAELFVQSRRPVYNSSYVTTALNWRDTRVEFEYTENAPIEIVQSTINNNLVAVIAFYCNMILALDFDSFSLMGGSIFYRQAQTIATLAQSNSGWQGWSAFDDNKSKTSMVNAYYDESLKPFREFWYLYHRKGLDEMAANPDRARTTILNALPTLSEMKNTRGSEIIIQMFADSKLDELVSIAGKASKEEKKEIYDLLRKLYPTMSSQLEPLKK